MTPRSDCRRVPPSDRRAVGSWRRAAAALACSFAGNCRFCAQPDSGPVAGRRPSFCVRLPLPPFSCVQLRTLPATSRMSPIKASVSRASGCRLSCCLTTPLSHSHALSALVVDTCQLSCHVPLVSAPVVNARQSPCHVRSGSRHPSVHLLRFLGMPSQLR